MKQVVRKHNLSCPQDDSVWEKFLNRPTRGHLVGRVVKSQPLFLLTLLAVVTPVGVFVKHVVEYEMHAT
jgi:hypothetical protein